MEKILSTQEMTKKLVEAHFKKQQEIVAEGQTILDAMEKQSEHAYSVIDFEVRISDLRISRESILADNALNVDNPVDIKAIESELAELETTVNNGKDKANAVEATIKGLQRKLGEVQARLEQHNSTLLDLVNPYLTEKAFSMGQDYMNAALQLDLLYANLLALGRVICGVNGGAWHTPTLTRACWDDISIPLFSLPACSDYPDHHLRITGKDQAAVSSLVDQWKDELRSYGMKL